jgi:fumarate reductase subunit D
MSHADDWRHLRKTVFGICLIVGPLLLLVGGLLTLGLYDGDDEARYLAEIADNEALYYGANMVGALGALFLVGAVIAIAHLVRVRHPRFAIVAGALALAGVVTMSGVWMTFTIIEIEMAQSADRAAMAALIEASDDSATIAPLFITFVGASLGLVLLAIGLWRAHTVPRWIPALMAVAFVLLFVGESGVVGTLGSVAAFVALGAIGLLVLRSTDEAWEAGDLAPPSAPMAPQTPAAATP